MTAISPDAEPATRGELERVRLELSAEIERLRLEVQADIATLRADLESAMHAQTRVDHRGPWGDRRSHRRHPATHLAHRRPHPLRLRSGQAWPPLHRGWRGATAPARVPRRDGRGYGRGVMKKLAEGASEHRVALSASIIAALIMIVLIVLFWGWLSDGESGSTTIRNMGLVIGGAIALAIAGWRSVVADRQSRAAQRQAETAEADLLNKRYQDGAAMLGSEVLAVRLAGIYALRRLAEEHAQECHIQAMRLLAAFVRHPGIDPGGMLVGGRREGRGNRNQSHLRLSRATAQH